MTMYKQPPRLLIIVLVLLLATISGCSDDSAPVNHSNPPPPVVKDGDIIEYKGPNPTSADVQRFLVNVWSNLATQERCGACHAEGGQAPQFARRDDIDAAYSQALTIVDLQAPSQSRMVTKLAAGHNCWREEASVCADTLTTWLEAWASAAGVEGNVIVLTPPEVKVAGSSLAFPEDSTEFAEHVHTPYLLEHCADCHSPSGSTPQQPYFADKSVEAAYEAAKSKLNLSAPSRSRMVVRLREESHNCWTANCDADADALAAAIAAFAGNLEPTEIDDALVTSNALQLGPDGLVASAGGRIEPNVIAKYEFKTGRGQWAFDTSGQDPALDLQLRGDVDWLDGGVWGLRFLGGRAQAPTAASAKLHKQITFTGEYTIEAWVAAANVTQEGPARIVSYSGGDLSRNFTLGQTLYNYDFLNRTTDTDLNADPRLSTPDADEALQATLQHVVATFNILDGRRIYVNGNLAASDDVDMLGEGSLNNWDDTFALVLGAETSAMYPWLGTLRFLAIHNRALAAQDVKANYEVGVGEKFYLLFRVTDSLEADAIPQGTDAYIVFEVEPFDSYSYLFANPFFYLLDPNKTSESAPPVPLTDIALSGIRIGINGREAPMGQAFANVSVTVSASNYVAGEGLPLSSVGALIPIEQGKEADEFFLTFDRLGSASYSRPAEFRPPVAVPEATSEAGRAADIGIKTFAEVNASLALMTGVPITHPAVRETYRKVEQQLPVDENIEGFLPAHHMGITQLSVAYCNALVADASLRSNAFDGFDFDAAPSQAFMPAGRAMIVDSLANVLVLTTPAGAQVESGPSKAMLAQRLDALIDQMVSCGTNCPAGTTQTTVTAVCAAALGSAAMLVQ
ncbi:MAG TPA: LamG domain-containing protein [Marinagarivorans sp.]